MTVELFRQELQVLNVGLALFADAISSAGGKVTAIEWAPPARGDCDAARALRVSSIIRALRPRTVGRLMPISLASR